MTPDPPRHRCARWLSLLCIVVSIVLVSATSTALRDDANKPASWDPEHWAMITEMRQRVAEDNAIQNYRLVTIETTLSAVVVRQDKLEDRAFYFIGICAVAFLGILVANVKSAVSHTRTEEFMRKLANPEWDGKERRWNGRRHQNNPEDD